MRVNRCTCVRSRIPRSVYRQRPPSRLRRIAQFATFGVLRTSRPSLAKVRAHTSEKGIGVAQVLDEVAAENDVEGGSARRAAPSTRRRRRGRPRRRFGRCGSVRVTLDADDRAAALDEGRAR